MARRQDFLRVPPNPTSSRLAVNRAEKRSTMTSEACYIDSRDHELQNRKKLSDMGVF